MRVVLTVAPDETIRTSLVPDFRPPSYRYIARCRMCGQIDAADSVAFLELAACAHASTKKHTIDIEDHDE